MSTDRNWEAIDPILETRKIGESPDKQLKDNCFFDLICKTSNGQKAISYLGLKLQADITNAMKQKANNFI